MYTQEEKDKMAMKNSTIDKFAAKRDCDDGYYWNGTECVKKGPLHSTGAKLGVGAGIAGALGLATSMIVDARNTAKAKKEAKAKAKEKALKESESKGTVAPRSVFDKNKKQ
jgi:hypothetical protein